VRRNTTLAGRASLPALRFDRALPTGGKVWRYTGGLTAPALGRPQPGTVEHRLSNLFNP